MNRRAFLLGSIALILGGCDLISRRRGGGTGGFVVPAFTVRTLTSAPNGGWSHANDPHAVQLDGWVYAGYVDMANGNVEVVAYEIATGTTTTTVVKAALAVDDHVSPALLIRASDHKLLVVYSQHAGASIWRRISTTSLDTDPDLSDGFGTESSLDASLGGILYTYPTLLQLVDETNDPIYLFYRDRRSGGISSTLAYSVSTDGGDTWAAQTLLFENGTKSPYFKITGDGSTRIDVATSDSRVPGDTGANSKVFHFWYETGDWHTSDGTVISASMPFAPADLTEVYDGTDGTGWPMDVVPNGGNPIIAYAVVTGASDNDWRYARWTGSAWTNATISASNGVLEGTFAASVCLDHADPTYTYAPVMVNDRWEIKRFHTTDLGLNFTPTAITSGSAFHNLQPVCVRDHTGEAVVLWRAGMYSSFTSNSTGIKGVSG